MKTTTKVISAADTAVALRIQLGTLRSWSDFLSDNIRGKQSINGLTLLPCAKRHDGRAFRPVYAVDDVQAFIKDVKAIVPSASGAPIKTIALEIENGRHWRFNKFNEDGSTAFRRMGHS